MAAKKRRTKRKRLPMQPKPGRKGRRRRAVVKLRRKTSRRRSRRA